MNPVLNMLPFSRALWQATFYTTILALSSLFPVQSLVFDHERVSHRYEAWRLFSSFLYAGPELLWRRCSYFALFCIYLQWKISSTLEDDLYPTLPADLAWQTLIAGSAIITLNVPLHTPILFPELLIAYAALLASRSSRSYLTFAHGIISLPMQTVAPALVIMQVMVAQELFAVVPALSGLLVGYAWAWLLERRPNALAAPRVLQFVFPDQPEKPILVDDGLEDTAPPPQVGGGMWDGVAVNVRAVPRLGTPNFHGGCRY
ncbi:hypothetical protein EXIGLDRAFT_45907 [Exidia glandulosa HHB12029]|uniref:Derlin n=1 Tax=Exidia glandulosa HHB12029 TaxID=1314781 RepID=A0A166BJB1_EXIGL|nr:hypothetical protein EXIGLDRAFT_45907 [Exidia glandulosa HHB12029]